MHRPWMRNTAISCAIAYGALVAGPGVVGTAVASADLSGIDLDIQDIVGHHKDNKKKSDYSAKVSAQQNGGTKKATGPRTSVGANSNGASRSSGPASRSAVTAEAPESATLVGPGQAQPAAVPGDGGGAVPINSSIARAPSLAPVPTTPSSRGIVIRAEPPAAPATAAVPAALSVAAAPPAPPGPGGQSGPRTSVGANSNGASQSSRPASRSAVTAEAPESATLVGPGQAQPAAVSGGGGGGVPINSSIGRAPSLAPVPTTPSSRGIVIRAEPPAAPAVPAAPPMPGVPPVAVAPPPVVIVPPAIAAPLPSAPGGGPIAPIAPAAPPAPIVQPPGGDTVSARAVPESFRAGYADYLRVASTGDLLFAVLPGVAGIVLLTAAGSVVGFRQARAAQNLPSPQITRFLP